MLAERLLNILEERIYLASDDNFRNSLKFIKPV